MVGIKEIASTCGVNPATVSRALNGQKGVSAALRDKIVKTALACGYKKNILASGLSNNKSSIIGMIMPDLANPYYALIAKGAASVIEPLGYSLLPCSTDRSRDKEKQYFAMMKSCRIAGLIAISVGTKYEDLELLLQDEIPIVAVDNPIDRRLSCVLNDNYSGAYDLMEHLVSTVKIKNIVLMMGDSNAFTTKERLRACMDVLNKYGLNNKLLKTMYIEASYEGGYLAAHQALQLNPDAVFAINDSAALGVMAYCHDHHIDVPKKVKIAGFDDIPLACMLQVPLTTVHQRKFKLGEQAARQLLKEIEDRSAGPINIELYPRLIVRASCGESFSREHAIKNDLL